jgi:hypothetical protein
MYNVYQWSKHRVPLSFVDFSTFLIVGWASRASRARFLWAIGKRGLGCERVVNKGLRKVGRVEDFRSCLRQSNRCEDGVTLNTQPGCGEGIACMCRPPPKKKSSNCEISVLLHNAIELIK